MRYVPLVFLAVALFHACWTFAVANLSMDVVNVQAGAGLPVPLRGVVNSTTITFNCPAQPTGGQRR